jgi:hypothetical protein
MKLTHVSAAMDKHRIPEELLGVVTHSVLEVIKGEHVID